MLFLGESATPRKETDPMDTQAVSGGHPALTDDQTGLPNRLHFDTVFDVAFAVGRRGVPLTVIHVEVAGLSKWSEERDEEETGRVLRSIGLTVGPIVRQSDFLARTEVDRFSLCLIDCNLAGAAVVAHRMDGLLDSIRGTTGLEFSAGGAAFDTDMEHPEDLLAAAEEALGVARRRGSNRVEFHLKEA
jgi:diguanylate cyclase (GGDEF)-like protein